MTVFFCPRCAQPGEQADGYAYCTRCRNRRQNEARSTRGAVFICRQCGQEGEKHPDYKLCIQCGAVRDERREAKNCKGLKSREEQSWMKGFNELSQDYLKRRLV